MRLRFLVLLVPLAAGCGSSSRDEPAPVPPPDSSGPFVERPARGLATFPGEPTVAIAVDDRNAYVTTQAVDGAGGSVWSVPLDGASPKALLAKLDAAPFAIAVDADWVYFTVRDRGTVQRVAKTGGSVATIAVEPRDANGAEAIALDADHVYWTAVGGVFRAPKSGGPAERVAEDDQGADALAVDGGEAFWIARGTSGDTNGALYKVRTSGGDKVALGTGPIFMPTWGFSIAVSGKFVFVPDSARGRVYRVDRDTGELGLVADGQPTPTALAADASHVYWSTGGNQGASTDVRTVSSAPVAGGAVEQVVATRQANVFAIAVGDRGVYFTDYVSSGTVWAGPLAKGR